MNKVLIKETVEKETSTLTEVDTYDWIAFLPMIDGEGAYNRYFDRLNTGKMKIRGVMARKPEFFLYAMIFAIGVNFVAGLYTAWKASRMDPVEATGSV